ncbi:thioredoxin reductase glit-like protein [Amylocarpus encephaloides]|uniref:Thioredoxin reductase glit-like protein n=1 Tax=Amylocarpus encephaloides TaxID=45428 RepID=A0A9P8C3E1_9HELO|nr:thioredoxin reductase glit-like protein [Amylocarpus encephaloides]
MAEAPLVDAIIIGGGPAGLSAAMTLGRQNHSVILFDSEQYRSAPSEALRLVPSWDGKPPSDLLAAARLEIKHYPQINIKSIEAASAAKRKEGYFEILDIFGTAHLGKKLILANGVCETYPDINGYRECWGKSIFHCLFCDGYGLPDGRTSGVLAEQLIAIPRYAIHMAHMAAQLTSQVTIYTNGNSEVASGIAKELGQTPKWKTDSRGIKSLQNICGGGSGIEIHFHDGSVVSEAFLAHSPLTRVRGQFAEQLGLELTPSGEYKVKSPTNQASVEGVYAAGDCMTNFKVTMNALASGSVTASCVAIRLHEERYGLPSLH